MTTKHLKITGGCVGLLLMGTLYGHIRKRRKYNLASQLFSEISKIINPATEGLVAEDAFDIHYLDKVLGSVSGKGCPPVQPFTSALIRGLIEW